MNRIWKTIYLAFNRNDQIIDTIIFDLLTYGKTNNLNYFSLNSKAYIYRQKKLIFFSRIRN